MHPGLVATAILAMVLIGCDVNAAVGAPAVAPAASAAPSVRVTSGTAASAAATTAPPAAPEAPTAAATTHPPARPLAGAKVSILPASTGPLGSMWLLQLTGFPAGSRITETITNPAGVPKSAFVNAGADGSASVTFQTAVTDQPGVGRYTFRFDVGTVSVTTTIDVTRPQ
ncbi:MAG TPA: hypothetical protein VGT60_10380 [Candidatus Limnocylindria bacterium]|nr:hypothetical protein [Candidatus Limnocylindria bacterium]